MVNMAAEPFRRRQEADLLQTRLAAGDVAIGCFVRYPDAGLTELLALSGLDFLVFDAEHGTLSPYLCEHLIRAGELHGVTPLVRIEENRPATILRYLDAGALGCHVPSVHSASDAAEAVRAVKFHPHGKRGLSASRASGYGPAMGYPAFAKRANDLTRVIVHIESARGVSAATEIAAVEGVDVLLLGSLDLSQDLGVPGEVSHPDIMKAAVEVCAAATRAGKVFGAVASDRDSALKWVTKGARYLIFPIEALIRPSVREYVSLIRKP